MNSERVGKVLASLLSLYMVTVGIAAVRFNWEFARTNGFVRWLLLGEIVSTAKAVAWPYFFHSSTGREADDTEIERTRLTPRQVSEMETKKFVLAINYSQQGTYLLNSTPHEDLGDYPNLQDILAYRRRAIEVGKSADRDVLNNIYPALRDKFEDEFVEAISLFVHGCETYSDEELRRSKILNDEWADWYLAHRKPIEDAANAAIGAQ